MPGTSAYIQISDYALLEYQYNNEYIPISSGTGSAGALRLENKYLGTYQYLNTNQSVNLTGNVLDRTAARMGGVINKWSYFDIDTPTPIYEINSNFVIENETANLTTLAGRYDTVRLHILSGFNFPGLDGIILQIRWKEWQLNNSNAPIWFDACNLAYLKDQPQIQFSVNPLFLGDRLYDRYLEIKIPSLYNVNQDFWNSPTATNTIGYQYTTNNVGFQQDSQIYANLYEIDSTETQNGNLYLSTGSSYNTSFNAQDNYSQLGVVIQENAEYDYIEYYPTWNGAFIETYINDLNSVGGDWVVINQLEIYEQIGTTSMRTANMTMLQEGNYDQPGIYRPVIQNSAIAFSYTIDYTLRFFNRVNNTEIIRKSSFTSTDVKKYGKQLDKINVLQGFTPVKVYNKIVQMSSADTANLSGITVPKQIVIQKVVTPVYYDTNYLSVDSSSNLTQTLGQDVWPQGTNTIYIGPFDNIIKFKIFTLSPDNKENVSLDMSSFIGNVSIAFNTVDNNRVYIPVYTDINLANPNMGEVAFRIDSATAVKILASTDKNYFIVNHTNPETVLYSGKFDSIANKSAGQTAGAKTIMASLDSQIAAQQAKLAELNSQIQTASTTTMVGGAVTTPSTSVPTPTATTVDANASTANVVLQASQAEAAQQTIVEQSILTQAQAAQQTALQQASQETGFPITLNIVEVPGVSPNLGSNPQATIKPLVKYPAEPTYGYNASNNPTKSGNTKKSKQAPANNLDSGV